MGTKNPNLLHCIQFHYDVRTEVLRHLSGLVTNLIYARIFSLLRIQTELNEREKYVERETLMTSKLRQKFY